MTEPADTDTGKRLTAAAVRVVGYLIYAYLVFVEVVLFLGFFLLLFGANSSAGFVDLVYRSLDRAMRPFRGIFEPIELGVTGNDVPAVFDTSVLFAMVMYGILAIALHSLLDWLTNRISRIDRQNELRAQQAAYQQAIAVTTELQAYGAGPAAAVPGPTPQAAPADPARTTPTSSTPTSAQPATPTPPPPPSIDPT